MLVRQRFLVHSGKAVGDTLLNVKGGQPEGCETVEGSARAHNAAKNALQGPRLDVMTSLGFAISAICGRPVTFKGSSKVSGGV